MNNNILNAGFKLFNLNISWYGLIIAVAIVICVYIAFLICKKKNLSKEMPVDLAIFALPCAIIGARLYYCIFNGVDSFWQIFEIWKGGLAIYGGIIGGFLGIVLCCKVKKYSLLQSCDLAAPCLIFGQAIGRIGCYYAGCCYGVETTIQSLQVFPLSVQINGVWHLATFFYESFFNIIGFVILVLICLKQKNNGTTTSSYLIFYGVVRCVLEQFRDPAESLTIASTGIRVSQLLSLILVIIGAIGLVLIYRNSKKNV